MRVTPVLNRRGLLASGAAASWSIGRPAAGSDSVVGYIIPSATKDRLAIKVWLLARPSAPPRLTMDGREARATALDGSGQRWLFEGLGLAPDRAYWIELRSDSGVRLRAPWQLRTLPEEEASPDVCRILVFTCAGGDPATPGLPGRTAFLPIAARQALLDRALSLKPDLVIANGDHVYWDQTSNLEHPNPDVRAAYRALYAKIAAFEPDLPASHPANIAALETVLLRQVAEVYGQRLCATPAIFIPDDHDYFENDVAGPTDATFPPKELWRTLQARAKALAYPHDFGMTRAGAVQRFAFGRLAEVLLYDCRLGLGRGAGEGLLSSRAEALLGNRTRRSTASALVHVPSTPFGWTAGKWAEWYGDRNSAQGASAYADDKAFWNPAWFEQHQRILTSLSNRHRGTILSVSGDLHASGACEILESGSNTLARPVPTVLAGPIGTGDLGFPSAARGQGARLSTSLVARQLAPLREQNGFAILDVHKDRIETELYTWRPPASIQEIASLQPSARFVIDA